MKEMIKEIYAYPHIQYNDGLSDFCLIYDSDKQTYSFQIETLLGFADETNGPKKYIESVLSDFTEWMKENDYQTDHKVSFWEYFHPAGVAREYKSIEQAYGVFKTMIQGFLKN